jgi:hypothetical protein
MTSNQVHPITTYVEYLMQVIKDNWVESFSEYTQMVEGTTIEFYRTPLEPALAMNEQSKQAFAICLINITEFTHSSKGQVHCLADCFNGY